MAFPVAEAILTIATAYAIVGCIVSVAFLVFGLDRLDSGAHQSVMFRALLAPGLALLWPLTILRWSGRKPDEDRVDTVQAEHHLAAWISMAVVIPLLLVVALAQRQVTVPQTSSTRISAPEQRP